MRNARKKLMNMSKEELQKISLKKNKIGIATREARIAQEILWDATEHIYTKDFVDSEYYFFMDIWGEYH